MNDDTTSSASAALSPRDLRLIDAYVTLGSLPEAAAFLGIDRTTAWRASQATQFQAEVQRRLGELTGASQAALLERQRLAWTAMDALLASDDERIRLRAAIWVLEHGLAEERFRLEHGTSSLLDLALEAQERDAVMRLVNPETDR